MSEEPAVEQEEVLYFDLHAHKPEGHVVTVRVSGYKEIGEGLAVLMEAGSQEILQKIISEYDGAITDD